MFHDFGRNERNSRWFCLLCVRGELRFQNSGNVAAKDVHEDKPADFGGLKRVLGNTIHYSNVAEKSMT